MLNTRDQVTDDYAPEDSFYLWGLRYPIGLRSTPGIRRCLWGRSYDKISSALKSLTLV